MTGSFSKLDLTLKQIPFRHVAAADFLDHALAEQLLDWFEDEQIWSPHNADGFYETYDLDLRGSKLPSSLQCLLSSPLIDLLTDRIGEAFGVPLRDWVDVTAHKLITGQKIGIHTDYGETAQTHRLLVQINTGWRMEFGGLLLLLSSRTPEKFASEDRAYVPHHRSAVGFEISPRSYHAVTPVTTSASRYTLCFSFYRA